MSVILLTTDCYETIRETVQRLAAQTVREQLELIIVAPSEKDLGLVLSDLRCFQSVRVVEVGAIRSSGSAEASGLASTHAAVVAFAEDHSFPEPQWAEALIAAHQAPWAAVGPSFLNANPGSALSWANLFISFGPWVESATSGIVSSLAWHNTSYKRDLLLGYGTQLEEMLNVEGVLQLDLRARGLLLYLESSARTSHVNITRVPSFIREHFYGGRYFAASRARYGNWSFGRRTVYVIGAPAIPLVRLWRTLKDVRRAGRLNLVFGMLPWLLFGFVLHSTGEALGYARGAGNSSREKFDLEHHRSHHAT
jgi:hypothetical protein